MGSWPRVVVVLTMVVGEAFRAAAGQPAGPAAAQPPCATCVAISFPPAELQLLPDALNGLEILIDVNSTPAALPGLLQSIAARGGRGGVLLHGLAGLPEPADLAGAATIVLDLRDESQPLEPLLFALRTATTAIRAADRRPSRIVVDPPERLRASLEGLTLEGYWDALVGAADGAGWKRGGILTTAERALAETRDPSRRRVLLMAGPDAAATSRALADLALAARWMGDRLVADDGRVRVTCGDEAAPAIYRDPVSLDRVALLERCEPGSPIVIQPPLAFERVQLSSGAAIVRLAEPAADRFAADAEVAAPRRLTVGEIVARHQAAAARQRATVRTVISTGTLTVTFEAPGFPAPITVSSATTIYTDGGQTDLEQRDIRINGVSLRQRGTPKLPIIEPERVAVLPLSITLGDRYRYRLDAEDEVGGVRAYVVAFEPVEARVAGFRGRAWIAAGDFGVMRIEARQTALGGPVVSSEQTDVFTPVAPGVWVLSRSEVRQLYEGAAYRTPIHRVLAIETHEIDAADFAARRREAYASAHTILRDTPAGYRYVEGAARLATATGQPSPAVLPGGTTSRARTLAFGVIVDPNISQPLPFAGLSYVDFDLFGTGTQFNGFFGGTYGQLAFSVPSVAGTRWQVAGRAFGIASSYNDRAFVSGREQYDRNLRQRPAAASVWLVRPLTARVALRVGYDLDYTRLARSEVTAPDFAAPANQVAHGLRVELAGQRAGWEGSAWWVGSRRAGWRAWGRSGSDDYRPKDGDFQRYGGGLARSLVVSPRLVARVEVAAMGGHDLDRFSRYTFGTFDNRLHGYPSALIRYDDGGVARGVLGWSAGRFGRIDGFADTALVHDPGFSSGLTRFDGIGAALESPAPFGLLAAVEWGYGVQGVDSGGHRGTHVVRISGYKVF